MDTTTREMSHTNRELVVSYIRYKLSQKSYSSAQLSLRRNDVSQPAPPLANTEAVKAVLRDSAEQLQRQYGRTFGELSSHLFITPAQSDATLFSLEDVVNQMFRDRVNWGRIVMLFVFGGELCVQCAQTESGHMVGAVADWMTEYLDCLQPCIQSLGGWDHFAELYGKEVAADHTQSQESCTGPEESCTGPEESCTGLEESCTGQRESCTGPEESCTGLEESCTGQRESCTGLEESCTGQRESCTGPEESCTGPEESCTGPEESCTGQRESCTGQRESCTGPEESCTGPEESCTGQRESCTGPEESCTGQRESCTGSQERYTRSTKKWLLGGLAVLTGIAVGILVVRKWM
ncbi:B2CL1 protein, partial [Amia calva]|nr:B2CL1 protein [Amia calva]